MKPLPPDRGPRRSVHLDPVRTEVLTKISGMDVSISHKVESMCALRKSLFRKYFHCHLKLLRGNAPQLANLMELCVQKARLSDIYLSK